jgi:uncharacterized protein YhdP
MAVPPAVPAATPPAGGARGRRGANRHLRLALFFLGGALSLVALLLIAYELAAARVPQHRAALEELIRRESGLRVRFGSLAVRWGWYGPEAVFQEVELGEPDQEVARLRAPRLIVALDTWRMARSGHFEVARVTLENPAIDLSSGSSAAPRSAVHRSAEVRGAGARILTRWRGGEIDIRGGTLRTVLPGAAQPVTLGIRYAELRRRDSDWTAEAQVTLPQALGAGMHVALKIRSDPDLAEISSASLSIVGTHLELAGWSALAGINGRNDLPRAGTGELELHAAFVKNRLRSAAGRVAAEGLEWRSAAGAVLSLDRLRGNWQLTRHGDDWHLRVDALELGASQPLPATALAAAPGTFDAPATGAVPASLIVDATVDGSQIRARVQHAPLPTLAALARWYVPELPRGAVVLGGEARELTLDWSAQRPPGERFAVSADLQSLALTNPGGQLVLSGLAGQAIGAEDSVAITLHAPAARLTVLRERPTLIDGLEIGAHIDAAGNATRGWRLETRDLQVRREGLSLGVSGTIEYPAGDSPPIIDARALLRDSDVAVLASLIGPDSLAAFGAAGASLRAGRIENAELTWRGSLVGPPWSVPGTRFAGTLALRDASLRESDSAPEVSGLAARIDWHGAHFHAAIARARAGGFALSDALADWDARPGRGAHFTGRLAGDLQQGIDWLQSHPQGAAWAVGLRSIDLRGTTLLDMEVALPAAVAGLPPAPPSAHLTALLDGAQLRPVAGLPPLDGLRGTVAFAAGHLQRSTLTGQWLGGPASLTVAEHREHGTTVLTISGRGVMDARQALQVASGRADDAALSGSADWSALLTVVPGSAPPGWQLHADSSLAGVASRLPEPFAKAAGTTLPLHVDLQATGDAGQLRIALGERLAAVAALVRTADGWRIERGALRLGGTTPTLPIEPVVLLDGRVSQLDLPACLALWREAALDAALPALRAQLSATQLIAGTRSFPEVSVTADAAAGGGAVRLRSAGLSGSAHWPALPDAEHPALVHLTRFDIAQQADAALAAQLAAVLAPALQLAVDELQWQGRALGRFSGTLSTHGRSIEASDLALSGASGETRASAHCLESGCDLRFSLESGDAGAALTAFGFAPEVSARQAHLQGELRWLPGVSEPLATLSGSLHMRLEDGTIAAAADAAEMPFALLSVPALLAGMGPPRSGQPVLGFTRLSADYQLRDGQAVTPALHFDGDAEILVRGRVGLNSGDYDEQAWVLRGEERLPDAVRRLGPTPPVAALWLSLRDLLGREAADRARVALHLQGSWSHPIVTPVELR